MKTEQKKVEFSKKWLVAFLVITIIFCLMSYILAFLGLDSVSELSIAIVQRLIPADVVFFAVYGFQNSVRAYSNDRFVAPLLKGEDPENVDKTVEDSDEKPID